MSKRTRKLSKASASADDDWEDMLEETVDQTSGSQDGSRSGSLRKRRGRNVYIAASPKRQYSSAKRTRSPMPPPSPASPARMPPSNSPAVSSTPLKKEEPSEEWDQVKTQLSGALLSAGVFAAKYLADVLGTAINLLRRPAGVIIAIFVVVFVLGQLSSQIRALFAPLCYLPGVSSSAMCTDLHYNWRGANGTGPPPPPKWADYPKLVDVQSESFEQLLDNSVGGSSLALDIKKAEMATTDLVTVVRYSDLTSRDLIANSLKDFVNDAKTTGRGLQKLSSKIGGAVDSIMAVNDHALHRIDAASSDSPSILESLWPFSTPQDQSLVITETFTHAMDMLSRELRRLIVEAELSRSNLEKLETSLATLHEIVAREDASLLSAKGELLSELWTILGGNRRKLRGFDDNLYLLRELTSYRKRALVHVVTALQTLTAMSEDMDDLRERVAAPELVGSRIPVDVHMRSIRNGLERLREGREKAKEREEAAAQKVLSITGE